MQPVHTSHANAKSTARSTLSVSHHDLEPNAHTAVSARWLDVHRTGKACRRQETALLAASKYVWDMSWVVGLGRRTCI